MSVLCALCNSQNELQCSAAGSPPPLLARLLLSVLTLFLLAAAAPPSLLLLLHWQVLVRVVINKLIHVSSFLTL